MSKQQEKEETIVKYGNVSVRVIPRYDGKFDLIWSEAGKRKKSTATKFDRAKKRAKDIAVRVDGAVGGSVLRVFTWFQEGYDDSFAPLRGGLP